MSRHPADRFLITPTPYRGIDCEKPDTYNAYLYPIRIYSQDDNDPEMRCGVLSFCAPVNGQWLGFTVFHLFTKTWNPDAVRMTPENTFQEHRLFGDLFDPAACVTGKTCYRFAWMGDQRADKTTDATLLRKMGRIGTVIKGMPEGNMATILLDAGFVASPGFRTEGFWARLGR